MDDRKPFAIVIDESKKKIVVPSNWLSNDCETLYWPTAITDPFKLKKAIISCKSRANGWQEYDVTRFIKYKDTYEDAVSDIRNKLDEVPNASSDDIKVKKSRSKRAKREFPEYEVPKGKPKRKRSEISSSEDSENSDGKESDDSMKDLPQVPMTLFLQAPSDSMKIADLSDTSLPVKDPLDVDGSDTDNDETSPTIDAGSVEDERTKVPGDEIPKKGAKHAIEKDSELEQPSLQIPSKKVTKMNSELKAKPSGEKPSQNVSQKTLPKIIDISNLEFSNAEEGMKLIAGLVARTITKVNGVLENQKTIMEKLKKVEEPAENSSNNMSIVDNNAVKIMANYFPIDGKEKKMEAVEEKLKSKRFFNNLDFSCLQTFCSQLST